MSDRLRQIDGDLWVAEQPLRAIGAELGTRMTVVRLPDSRLWIHSPIAGTQDLRAELDALGSVAHIVAPNCFHHVFAKRMGQAYPSARLYAAPGLQRKRLDIPFSGTLGPSAPEGWGGVIELLPVGGIPKLGEVAFFHAPTHTLILTDILFNFRNTATFWTGIVQRTFGTYGRPACSRLVRMAVKDHRAFRASIEQILEWDFDRVTLCHGEVLETGGPDVLRSVFGL